MSRTGSPHLPLLVDPEVLSDAGQCVAPLHRDDLPEETATVRAAEGDGGGVVDQALHAAHTHAVTTGQLTRVLKDVLTHRAG